MKWKVPDWKAIYPINQLYRLQFLLVDASSGMQFDNQLRRRMVSVLIISDPEFPRGNNNGAWNATKFQPYSNDEIYGDCHVDAADVARRLLVEEAEDGLVGVPVARDDVGRGGRAGRRRRRRRLAGAHRDHLQQVHVTVLDVAAGGHQQAEAALDGQLDARRRRLAQRRRLLRLRLLLLWLRLLRLLLLLLHRDHHLHGRGEAPFLAPVPSCIEPHNRK